MLQSLHHIAVLCSDEAKALDFYGNKLGFEVVREIYREDRGDTLRMLRKGDMMLELFIKPRAPAHEDRLGARHLCFRVENVEEAMAWLERKGIAIDSVIRDPFSGGRIAFFHDPDGLPLELHE